MSKAKTSVRKALSLSFTRTCIAFVFNIVTVTIVSRLLTPAEIGVFSVAVALVALAHMLRDFGVTELIVQEKELSQDVVRTAFTVNLVIAWLLAAILYACSDFIGAFYGHPGVDQVTKVLSLVFVLMPFGTTTLSCIKREMEFGLLVRIQIAETAVRSISTVVLAYLGFSYMSMAWASVAAMAVVVIASVVWGGEYRVRGFGLVDWKRVLHFGSNRTIADIVRQLGEQSANIVIGRMLGMAPAGFYSRGYGIVNMFRTNVIGTIGLVAFPAYAREHRTGNAAPWLFRKALVYVTGVSWPFFVFAALMAYPIIHIMFGNQWDASIPLMRWLCVAALVGTLSYQCNGLLVAVGRYREATRVQVQYELVRIALVVLAAFHSLQAVAASQVLVYLVAAWLYYRKLVRYDALRPGLLVAALLPSAALTLVTSMAPVAVLLFWPGLASEHYVAMFLVAAAGTGTAWLAGVFLLGHPLSAEIGNAMSLLRERIRSRMRCV